MKSETAHREDEPTIPPSERGVCVCESRTVQPLLEDGVDTHARGYPGHRVHPLLCRHLERMTADLAACGLEQWSGLLALEQLAAHSRCWSRCQAPNPPIDIACLWMRRMEVYLEVLCTHGRCGDRIAGRWESKMGEKEEKRAVNDQPTRRLSGTTDPLSDLNPGLRNSRTSDTLRSNELQPRSPSGFQLQGHLIIWLPAESREIGSSNFQVAPSKSFVTEKFGIRLHCSDVARRSDKRAPERTRSKGVFFGRSSDQTVQTEQWSFNSDALPPEPLVESQRPLLPSSPPPNFCPSIPRLKVMIPPAPPGSITASTVDHPDMSAAYSSCMDSPMSTSSHVSEGSASVILHATTAKIHRPSLLTTSSSPYGVPTTDVAAVARPFITTPQTRRSLHPVSGGHLVAEARMPMDAIVELPSAFISMPVRRDTLPVSPLRIHKNDG
ncbi:hypothetical protein B0H11DRAFT_2194879 [Mycena galericulata]|nr:hypothetical protein B0H11DRAFT_2194879 [Mycena galericulata]